MATRTLILEVDEDKADALVDALSQRSYLNIFELDREQRRARKACPCCGKRLSKEKAVQLNEGYAVALLRLARMMRRAKSIIITNKSNPRSKLPPVEHDRCLDLEAVAIRRLVDFGLVREFADGNRVTYHLTTAGIEFLRGAGEHSPAILVYIDENLIETSDSISLEQITFKQVDKNQFVRDVKEALDSISAQTMSFVMTGQMPLV